jgi:hypothetical protein
VDVFVLEIVTSSGTRRGGRTFWTEAAAVREAERLVRTGKAATVRVLIAAVRNRPAAEVTAPEGKETGND